MKQCNSLKRQIGYWVLLALLMTAAGFLLLTNLGVGISDSDEHRHGINAYEMLQSGDYVVSTYEGEPDYWNLKPPLALYSMLAGFRLFGLNAFGMRFYSAVSMLLLILVMALWMKKHYGSLSSIFTVLFWLGCGMVYRDHFARYGDADTQLLLFYTLSMLCMLSSHRNIRWLYGSALCFGLAFMSKSWHAALIPLTCLVDVILTGNIRKLKVRNFLALIGLGLLPILPWAIARYQRDGFTFFEKMLTLDVINRATTVVESHTGGLFYYVSVLFTCPAAVACMVVGALGVGLHIGLRKPITKNEIGIAVWLAVPLMVYSLAVSKLKWYSFPMLPPLAMALGLFARECPALKKRQALRIGRGVLLCAMAGVLCVCAVGNWRHVAEQQSTERYQGMIIDYFDRDTDSGTHIYLQCPVNGEDGSDGITTDWIDSTRLTAMLYGDLICMEGGAEAFLEDEEHAYLLCHKMVMDYDILEEYPIVQEDGPLMLVENFN